MYTIDVQKYFLVGSHGYWNWAWGLVLPFESWVQDYQFTDRALGPSPAMAHNWCSKALVEFMNWMNTWNLGQLDVQYPDCIHKNVDTERKYSKHEIWCFMNFLISPTEMVVYYLPNSYIPRLTWASTYVHSYLAQYLVCSRCSINGSDYYNRHYFTPSNSSRCCWCHATFSSHSTYPPALGAEHQ